MRTRRPSRFARFALVAASSATILASLAAGPAGAIGPVSVDAPVRPSLIRSTATTAVRVALQKRLDRLREREDIPGISVAILFPDGTLWQGTSGLANVRTRAPVATDTAFAVASVSKTFTSALIMALHDDGLIDLEAPVRQYLPQLAIDKRITVRELLDHTSGLADFFFGPGIDKALLGDRGRAWDFKRSLSYVGARYFKPGKGWAYSNTNYLILGALAEKVGGAPLAQQLATRFIGPLGMTRTYDQRARVPAGSIAHGYRFAAGHDTPIDLSDGTSVVPFTSVISAAGGAGAIASTPTDLVHWARALYGGGIGSPVSPESREAMFADVAATAKRHSRIPYGLGVQAIDLDGHPAYGHSGRLLGFRSLVRWLPQERIAIAILTNQSRTDPAIVARSLLRIALKPSTQCAACRAPI